MRKRFVYMLAFVGAVSIISSIAGLLSAVLTSRQIPDATVLTLNLEQPILEHPPPASLSTVALPSHHTTRDVVDALRRAATDDRIVAVAARVGGVGMGLAQIQEIRDAVLAFRESGKPAVVHAETFGEFGPGTGAYYLATAFETIYLQSSGDVSLTGLLSETPFIRGALEKLRVEPRFDARREYKSAVNLFTERGYTPAHREATQAVLTSHFEQIVDGIAAARELDGVTVRALIDRAPLPSDEALEASLVDRIAYRDEVWDDLMPDEDDPSRMDLGDYVHRAGRPDASGERVALIYGVGNVHRGKSDHGLLSRSSTMGADTVTEAFRRAIADEDVRAIVFRVDSPGGSYVASDVIWREVGRARRYGKPVVVSMGNVAGSGGYFVAMNADVIVAQPSTVTGSIGVLAGKLITGDFWERLGINWEELHEGRHATMWSATRDYTPSEWQRFQVFLDRIYDDFTAKVASGRELEPAVVERIARGRIWTGAQAKEHGLVDELGGLTTALALVRDRLALAPDAPIDLVEFPRPRPLVQVLLSTLTGERAALPPGGAEALAVLGEIDRLPGLAQVLRGLDDPGPLMTPWPGRVW